MGNIYRRMIEDSPMAYVHIKATKDIEDKYIKIEIKDANRSFIRLFDIDIDCNNVDINEIFTKEEVLNLKRVLKRSRENERYMTEKYIKSINSYLNLEIYNENGEDFYIRLTKICKQAIKLSAILKNSPLLVWIKDRNGVYVDVNHTYANYFHVTPEDLIGKTDYDIWYKEHADKLKEEDEYVVKENKLCKIEEVVYIDGKKTYLETSKWPYTDKENDIILGTIGIAMIANDKVELRKNIQKNEEIFKEIADNIEEVIIIRDEKKALYVSPSFEKVYGVTPEALNMYENIDDWYDYWDDVEFEEECNIYDTCEVTKDVFKISKKGREDTWLWSRFAPIFDENGNIIKRVGIVSDITDSKKIEEEINNMKMDFFANISHELRTPINLIFSSLQVIYQRLYNLDSEDLEFYDKYLSMINQNGLRLLKLVNNLIDTTRLDAGNFDYIPQDSDIISCIENICISVADFIEKNNLTIIFDTNEEEKIVSFDSDHMERIILNLLSNAIKFNKPGGNIKVNIECGEEIKISVKDSGIGIPSDKLEKIFERFEQVKNKFKKEREGSGIGLSLVKSLVELHSGQMDVKSNINEGTEFIIIIPDTLIENESKSKESGSQSMQSLSNVNKMNLEFSDIYG